jgi:cytochrome c oxidase accessory protein FixG
MTNDRFQPWRRRARVLQALLVLGIPFIQIKGESILRFDVPTLTLLFFGAKVGVDEFFLVLVVILFLGFLLVLLTILFGRIWCGWLCPQTVIIDFTHFVDAPKAASGVARILSFGGLLLISSILAASLLWYFVSPYDFLGRLRAGNSGVVLGGSWAVLTLITFLNFAFLRHRFCSTICPYARMQGALYDDRTLIIGPEQERMAACMHCDACVRICPVHIDVREGLNAACINCAECIDTCGRQMGRRGMRSLIGYRFGSGDPSRAMTRWGVILSAVATLVFLVLFLLLAASRAPIDVSVEADAAYPPRIDAQGMAVNSYMLSLTNRTDDDVLLRLTVNQDDGPLIIRPESLALAAHAHVRQRIEVVSDRRNASRDAMHDFRIIVQADAPYDNRIELVTTFLPPW